MTDCVIYRRFRGEWAWVAGADQTHARERWYARCPDCGEEITYRPLYPATEATRKNTKDALHRHRRERHGLGSVGRADGTNRRAVSGTYGRA